MYIWKVKEPAPPVSALAAEWIEITIKDLVAETFESLRPRGGVD